MSDVAGRVKGLRDLPEQLAALTVRLSKLERIVEATDRMAPLLFAPPAAVRDFDAIAAHARAAIVGATLHHDPAPHAVIDEVLPRAFYDYLLATLPPAECFRVHDAYKQDFYFDEPDVVPPFARLAWQGFERDVVSPVLMPALLELFAPVILPHYVRLLGDARAAAAAALPKAANGRVLLRRPGYRQDPHLDPKRVLFTGLIYLAKPGDSEDYGTALYRVDRPFVQPFVRTFYPETEGYTCTLAKRVEFRANRLLVFLNAQAAHGAELPADAPLQERYAYQFYVKPAGLTQVVKQLPAKERALWAGLPGVGIDESALS
ncbi:MAG: hypothetical protein ACRD26_23540 [Vicinamibacterales bacterium]